MTETTFLDGELLWDRPRWLSGTSAWCHHIPLAFYLVELARPRVFVELGTMGGDSYCAFCQAIDALALDAHCWAIDTWEGDVHTTRYPPDLLARLEAHHAPLYGGFSTLVRSTFDAAAGEFAGGSIDLLHIDGEHTYEAVSHDFETWLPKMSANGVILFHDTHVRDPEFGVSKLWDELHNMHPSFAFPYGHGLGVLAVGGHVPEAVLEFIRFAHEHEAGVTGLFGALGDRVALLDWAQRLEGELASHSTHLKEVQRLVPQLERRIRELENELQRVESSRSWRFTEPLRRVGSAAGSLRSNDAGH